MHITITDTIRQFSEAVTETFIGVHIPNLHFVTFLRIIGYVSVYTVVVLEIW